MGQEKKMVKTLKERHNERKDRFDLSDGNLKVLEMIPRMMKDSKYRKELRHLALQYMNENTFGFPNYLRPAKKHGNKK